MKPGPRIVATASVATLSDIGDTWKIAAWEATSRDGTTYWVWPIRAVEQGQLMMAIHGSRPTLSACRGQQEIDGRMTHVLYVRRPPSGVVSARAA